MLEFEPVILGENYERKTITDVDIKDWGWNITCDNGWSFMIQNDNPTNVTPAIGDTIIYYGKGLGYSVVGVQINSVLLYYKTQNYLEDERSKWIEETKKEYEEEDKKLMEKIKDRKPYVTADLSGFGGGYENCIQEMLFAGRNWLKENPGFEFSVKYYKHIHGISINESENKEKLDELEKLLDDASENQCSGMQHATIMASLAYIHKYGYEKWLSNFAPERLYTYPQELPLSTFGKNSI